MVRKRFLEGWTKQFTFLGRLKRAEKGKTWQKVIQIANSIEAEAVHSLKIIQGRERIEDGESIGALLSGIKTPKSKPIATTVKPVKALAAIVEETEGLPAQIAALLGRAGYGETAKPEVVAEVKPKVNPQKRWGSKPAGDYNTYKPQGDKRAYFEAKGIRRGIVKPHGPSS